VLGEQSASSELPLSARHAALPNRRQDAAQRTGTDATLQIVLPPLLVGNSGRVPSLSALFYSLPAGAVKSPVQPSTGAGLGPTATAVHSRRHRFSSPLDHWQVQQRWASLVGAQVRATSSERRRGSPYTCRTTTVSMPIAVGAV
jgi:hypothetical protein